MVKLIKDKMLGWLGWFYYRKAR